MNLKHRLIFPLAIALLTPAAADTIYNGLLDTPILLTQDGSTLTIGSGTLNPFYGGLGVANNNLLQPARNGTANDDTILNFTVGSVIIRQSAVAGVCRSFGDEEIRVMFLNAWIIKLGLGSGGGTMLDWNRRVFKTAGYARTTGFFHFRADEGGVRGICSLGARMIGSVMEHAVQVGIVSKNSFHHRLHHPESTQRMSLSHRSRGRAWCRRKQ